MYIGYKTQIPNRQSVSSLRVPVTSKEAYDSEQDRTEVRSLSHLKRTAPGFVWVPVRLFGPHQRSMV